MGKIRKLYRFTKEKYDLLILKKYTTLAGTLVFFLIMSIVPLAFWLTLFLGKLPIDPERILQLSVFDSVKKVLSYVRKEAQNATASISVLLLVTTLYSSTNFFYQMRRSGEIIYDYQRPKKDWRWQGWRLRLGALILTLIILVVAVLFALLLALGTFIFSRYLPSGWERAADYVLLLLVGFALVLLLNIYICPYKAKIKDFLFGSFVTVAAWAAAVVGFAVYLRISNMDKLYGALSVLIVFLLWLYILMLGFIAGVIFNSEKILARQSRIKNKQKKKNI